MAGINRNTGKLLGGWPHVAQSLFVLFTTHLGARVMRRHFGSEIPNLLGENMTPRTVMRFCYGIVVACELWEPRFRVRKIDFDPNQSPEQMRRGRLAMTIKGEYRPRGHLGDPTPARGDYVLTVGANAAGMEVLTS